MLTFKEYIEQDKFVDFVLKTINEDVTAPSVEAVPATHKPWSATKDEVMAVWQNLRPDTPIYMMPMPEKQEGDTKGHSSYGEDGIRITGSWQFIASVLARLKEIAGFENPAMKLRVVFRGVDPNRLSQPNRQAFAFYVNLEKRKAGKAGRPKGT